MYTQMGGATISEGKKKGPDNESLINCFWITQNQGLNRRQWWLTREQTEK